MFQFAGFALHTYVFSMQSFRDPGINARLTAPPGLSQSATPFFASWRQDIPHTLLFAWQHWPTALLTELRNQTSLLSAHISDHRTKTSSKLLRSLTLFNRQSSSSISRVLYSSHFCDRSQNYRRSLCHNPATTITALCDCNYRAPTKLSKNKDTHYRCLPWQLASFISVISSQSFSTALACLDSLTLPVHFEMASDGANIDLKFSSQALFNTKTVWGLTH